MAPERRAHSFHPIIKNAARNPQRIRDKSGMPASPPEFTWTYASLPGRFFEPAKPLGFPHAEVIAMNPTLAVDVGIDPEWLASPAGTAMVSGNALPPGCTPIAQAYAGHQFGGFVPRLGDGRAILLGEVNGFEIQLKGAGPTKFSRGGDGKSSLGPVIREFLVSEAMFALGVPTTRALAAVSTQEAVFRQNGPEPGGIFTRVARSHVRIGTFQYFAAQQDNEAISRLITHCGESVFLAPVDALSLLGLVVRRQASLVAHWMSLGFIHGVMNTDNCAISGETIDYGPCAFMDDFHPKCVFSSIDRQGRYAWENQAQIAHWNLTRLAEALLPVIDPSAERAVELAKEVLAEFLPTFRHHYLTRFRHKIGHPDAPESAIDATLSHMAETRQDFTLFFRKLTRLARGEITGDPFDPDWLKLWTALGEPDADLMATSNPVLIPRNHQVEKAIQSAYTGDLRLFHHLHAAWKQPFHPADDTADLETPPTDAERVRETFCGT